MTVKEIFDLRKQGHIEEAYEAIKARYNTYRGHYTTLCMFWTARDIFIKRLYDGRIEEATKIFQALQRVLPNIDDKDGRCAAFMQYASSRLDGLSRMSPSHGALASSCSSPFYGVHPDPKLQRLLDILKGDMSVKEMMAALGFVSRDKFLKNYLSPALKAGLVEMTQPDSPKSPTQRYRKQAAIKTRL